MFQVDRAENRIRRLEERRFGDLGLRERDHLQEWLADLPDALGEELLVIQKEFDGFADTRERLDLLALDKEGQLVVIENKNLMMTATVSERASPPFGGIRTFRH